MKFIGQVMKMGAILTLTCMYMVVWYSRFSCGFHLSRKFQTRITRSTLEGRLSDQESIDSEPQRVALTSLKLQGQKNRVAHERVGSSAIGSAGRVHQNLSKKNVDGPVFQIFQVSAPKLYLLYCMTFDTSLITFVSRRLKKNNFHVL